MTVEQAIEEVRRVGSLAVVASGIRYEIRTHGSQTAEALATLKARKAEAIAVLTRGTEQMTPEPLEAVLKGRAIELWSDALGERFWLVADEGDAAKLGEPRGSVYTAAEARRVVQIGDPAIVREIHTWKRTLGGRVRQVQKREPAGGTRAGAASDGSEGRAGAV